MEKFIECFRTLRKLKGIGSYRLCWLPFSDGNGMYSVIEFFDEELPFLDPGKVIIIV
jgi:hypothetical protein